EAYALECGLKFRNFRRGEHVGDRDTHGLEPLKIRQRTWRRFVSEASVLRKIAAGRQAGESPMKTTKIWLGVGVAVIAGTNASAPVRADDLSGAAALGKNLRSDTALSSSFQ